MQLLQHLRMADFDCDKLIGRLNAFGRYQKVGFLLTTLGSLVAQGNLLSDLFEVAEWMCCYGRIWELKLHRDDQVCPQHYYSATMEFGLQCNDALACVSLCTAQLLGACVGAVLAHFADWFGRKWVLLTTYLTMLVIGCSLGLSPTWQVLVALKAALGVCGGAYLLISYVHLLEVTDHQHRLLFAALCSVAFGVLWTGGLALLTGSWIVQSLLMNGLGVPIAVCYMMLLTESPRWLLAQGKAESAKALFRKIALINNKVRPLSEIDHDCSRLIDSAQHKVFTVLHAFRRCDCFTVHTVIMWLTCFSLAVVATTTGHLAEPLAHDFRINVTMVGCLATAFTAFTYLVQRCTKFREPKVTLTVGMAVVEVVLLGQMALILFVPQWSACLPYIQLVLQSVILTALASVFLLSAELFPTVVRCSVVGSCFMLMVLGGITGTFMVSYLHVYKHVPESACISLIGATIVALCLAFSCVKNAATMPDGFDQDWSYKKRQSMTPLDLEIINNMKHNQVLQQITEDIFLGPYDFATKRYSLSAGHYPDQQPECEKK